MGSMAVVLSGIGSDVPPPVIEAFSASEVKTVIIGVIAAFGSMIIALIGVAKRWADKKFNQVSDIQSDVKAVVNETVNNHGPEDKNINLRDQVDDLTSGLSDVLLAVKEQHLELRDGLKRMDHRFGEAHDRDIQTTRRIENLEIRAEEDHKQLRNEIERKKDK